MLAPSQDVDAILDPLISIEAFCYGARRSRAPQSEVQLPPAVLESVQHFIGKDVLSSKISDVENLVNANLRFLREDSTKLMDASSTRALCFLLESVLVSSNFSQCESAIVVGAISSGIVQSLSHALSTLDDLAEKNAQSSASDLANAEELETLQANFYSLQQKCSSLVDIHEKYKEQKEDQIYKALQQCNSLRLQVKEAADAGIQQASGEVKSLQLALSQTKKSLDDTIFSHDVEKSRLENMYRDKIRTLSDTINSMKLNYMSDLKSEQEKFRAVQQQNKVLKASLEAERDRAAEEVEDHAQLLLLQKKVENQLFLITEAKHDNELLKDDANRLNSLILEKDETIRSLEDKLNSCFVDNANFAADSRSAGKNSIKPSSVTSSEESKVEKCIQRLSSHFKENIAPLTISKVSVSVEDGHGEIVLKNDNSLTVKTRSHPRDEENAFDSCQQLVQSIINTIIEEVQIRDQKQNGGNKSDNVNKAFNLCSVIVGPTISTSGQLKTPDEHVDMLDGPSICNKGAMNSNLNKQEGNLEEDLPPPPPPPTISDGCDQNAIPDISERKMSQYTGLNSGPIIFVDVGSFSSHVGIWNFEDYCFDLRYSCPTIVTRPSNKLTNAVDLLQGASTLAGTMYRTFREHNALAGQDAWHCAYSHPDSGLRGALSVSCPISNDGVVADHVGFRLLLMHCMEKLQEGISDKNIFSHETRVIISHLNSFSLREFKIFADCFFENYNIGGMSLISQPVLYSMGFDVPSLLIVDIGEVSTRVIPVYESFCLSQCIEVTKIGGKHMTNYMELLLHGQKQEIYSSSLTRRRQQIAREIKEKHCFIAFSFEECIEMYGNFQFTSEKVMHNGDSEESECVIQDNSKTESTADIEVTENFSTADGNGISMTVDRELFYCPEVLFSPFLFEQCAEESSIIDAILTCVSGLDDLVRADICKTILLRGRSSQLEGLAGRLQIALSTPLSSLGVNDYLVVATSPLQAEHDVNMLWKGCEKVVSAALEDNSSLPNLISSSDFEKHGEAALASYK